MGSSHRSTKLRLFVFGTCARRGLYGIRVQRYKSRNWYNCYVTRLGNVSVRSASSDIGSVCDQFHTAWRERGVEVYVLVIARTPLIATSARSITPSPSRSPAVQDQRGLGVQGGVRPVDPRARTTALAALPSRCCGRSSRRGAASPLVRAFTAVCSRAHGHASGPRRHAGCRGIRIRPDPDRTGRERPVGTRDTGARRLAMTALHRAPDARTPCLICSNRHRVGLRCARRDVAVRHAGAGARRGAARSRRRHLARASASPAGSRGIAAGSGSARLRLGAWMRGGARRWRTVTRARSW